MPQKFLADENIPLDVVQQLQKDDINIISQSIINPGTDDNQILSYALKEQRVIITFDKDFGELIFKTQKKSSGVILLRVHIQSVEYAYSLLKKVLALKVSFNTSFCVVEPHRMRIIPLQPSQMNT